MRYRMYFYEFSNGVNGYYVPEEAEKFAQENGVRIVRDDCKREAEMPVKMVKDGFQIGYNPALGMHVRGRRHYNQILREKGLVEMGKEYRKPQEKKKVSFVDESVLKGAVEMGAQIGGVEAEALLSGTYDPPKGLEVEKGGFAKE